MCYEEIEAGGNEEDPNPKNRIPSRETKEDIRNQERGK